MCDVDIHKVIKKLLQWFSVHLSTEILDNHKDTEKRIL